MAAAPLVYFDLPAADPQVLADFYSAVFDWDVKAGPWPGVALITPFPVLSPMGGTIRKEQPGSGSPPSMVYVGVPDVTAALEAIVAAGGAVHAPRFEVPGTVILGLFNDPAGNAMGLVEMEGDKPKIP